MKTTVDFLTAVKVRYELPSNGRLAVKLGITSASVSRLMSGREFLGDENAMKVADLLDLDPAYVVACMHAERAKRGAVFQCSGGRRVAAGGAEAARRVLGAAEGSDVDGRARAAEG